MENQFELNGKTFIERTTALIYNKDLSKILLFTYKGKDYWLMPGGRVDQMEDSFTAIKREIKEELNMELDFKLVAIGECIMNFADMQSIVFFYKSVLKDNINDEYIKPIENDEQIYKWVELNEIENYNLKPDAIKEIIKDVNNNSLRHFIEIVN